jgi:hypothetical protein
LVGSSNLNSMKILFLDFDGVIAPLSYHHSSSGFSASACANVQSILTKDPNVRLVVSSAWRRWGLEKIREILKENGIDSTKVIGITETEGGFPPEHRAKQIKTWLKNHPEIKVYVAVDDYPLPKLDPNYLKCNGYVGFTQKDAEIALRILSEDK